MNRTHLSADHTGSIDLNMVCVIGEIVDVPEGLLMSVLLVVDHPLHAELVSE